ncbi:MAG: LptE family protein [Planctomycetes bacterium]|nr:LptE family protein [Planctomycetota bacterium]
MINLTFQRLPIKPLLGFVLLGFCILNVGCGYSSAALIRDDIRTVHIPTFANETWRRGLEVELTRAVTNEIKLHTRLNVKNRAEADSVLSGQLKAYDQRIKIKSIRDETILKQASVEVRFRWVDKLTGRTMAGPLTIRESKTFAPARSETLEELIFREAAQTIVEKLEERW